MVKSNDMKSAPGVAVRPGAEGGSVWMEGQN